MKLKLINFCLLIILSGCIHNEPNWHQINSQITTEFSQSKFITIKDLKQKLDNQEKVIIIDVRDSEEYVISRLQNALNIQSIQQIKAISKNQKSIIILYCSVGYRSGKIADQLTKMGFKNIYNLKGSIFEWANQGHKLVNEKGKTNFVHPYNEYWGRLLQQQLHKYTINHD